MNIIIQKREEANQYQNADMYLEDAISRISSNTKTLFVGKRGGNRISRSSSSRESGIYGELDFIKVTHGDKALKIHHLEIEEHQRITDLLNIPHTVKTVKAIGQLLTEFHSKDLKDLEQLYLQKNYIEKINLSSNENLKVVNLEDNHLREIKLPDSLEELYLSGNAELYSLDVSNLKKLKILDCKCPNLEKIIGLSKATADVRIQMGVTKILYGNIPDEVVKKERINIEYKDALTKYFELKHKYDLGFTKKKKDILKKDVTAKEKRKELGKYKRPCVSCRRPVGTIFKHTDGHYIAMCGDLEKPCKLKIKLFNGAFMTLEKRLDMMLKQVEELKERIIKYKLDTIFEYTGEGGKRITQNVIMSEVETYNTYNTYYNELNDLFKNTYHSPHKKELILAKQKEIYDILKTLRLEMANYLEHEDTTILQGIVGVYKRDLIPEIENLRGLKYPHYTMGRVNPFIEIKDGEVCEMILDKQSVIIQDREVSIHEEMPSVVSFQV